TLLFHLGMFLLRLFVMELGICNLSLVFQLGNLLKGLVCLTFLVVTVMMNGRLRNDFRTVSCLDCGVILLNLMDFAVNTGGKGIANLTDGFVSLKLQFTLSLWKLDFIFKVKTGFSLAAFLIKD